MALIDAINAGSHPATSAGAAGDAAAGYTSYLCADVELLNIANAEALFGAGVSLEDEMVIALPIAITPNLDGNNRFDFSDISAIANVVIALYRNSAGEWTSADLTVVPDTIGPVISIDGGYQNGDVLPAINVNDTWAPPTATALDDVDGSVAVTIDASGVDLSVAGNYFVGYEAQDAAGNITAVILTLPVQAPIDAVGPVITITGGYQDGDVLPSITVGDTLNPPGATAFDNEEVQAVSVNIDTSNVDNSQPGNGSIVYTSTDGSGNATTVTLVQPVIDYVVNVQAPLRDQRGRPEEEFILDLPANLFSRSVDSIDITLLDGSPLPAGFSLVGNRIAWSSPVTGEYVFKVDAVIGGNVYASDHFALSVFADRVVAHIVVTNDNGVPMSNAPVTWVAYDNFDGARLGGGSSVTNAVGGLSVDIAGEPGDVVMIAVRRTSDGELDAEEVTLVAA